MHQFLFIAFLLLFVKQIQWTWPDTFGEDKYVVVMGGLHIEMNVMKLLGDILTGSGWTAILVESLGQEDQQMDFKSWSSSKSSEIPQFKYWDLVLELELLSMQLVRSFREANFEHYVQCLGQIVPWMFAFDHTNYARWLPIHIKDMVQLKERVPSVYEEFNKGNFVVQKSTHVFSTMAMDQAHEQMNDLIKGDGGVIGTTEYPSA